MAKPIPDGYQTVIPHLVIKGVAEAIEFYKKAFGAAELSRMPMPDKDGRMKIGHAELQFGDSKVFLAEEFPDYGSVGPNGSSPVTIHLYVEDVDAVFAKAVEAGGRPLRASLVALDPQGRSDARAGPGAHGRGL
jgi:uncharacterized glyoxalase superfamily protein PhnB